jgi:pleckstrin homology domain-containing family A member 1/2
VERRQTTKMKRASSGLPTRMGKVTTWTERRSSCPDTSGRRANAERSVSPHPLHLSSSNNIFTIKTWKKRWFVLRTEKLAYYKNEQEYKLLRLLDLRDIHSAITVSLKHHQNTFGIVTPTRTFYIQAPSAAERDTWVRRLNEVRARLKDSVDTPPVLDTGAATSSIVSQATTAATTVPTTAATTTPARKATLRALATSLTPPSPNATSNFPPSVSPTSPSPTAAGFGITSSDSDDPFTAATTSPRPQKNKSGSALPDPKQQGIANDPKKVVLSGYLMKCGSKRKNWRKRWFVLTSEKLVYAKSHMVRFVSSLD